MATDNKRLPHGQGQVTPVKIIPTPRITIYRTLVVVLLLMCATGITVLIGNQQQQWRELKEHRGEASKYFANEVLSCTHPHTHAGDSVVRYQTVTPALTPYYTAPAYLTPNVFVATHPKKQP